MYNNTSLIAVYTVYTITSLITANSAGPVTHNATWRTELETGVKGLIDCGIDIISANWWTGTGAISCETCICCSCSTCRGGIYLAFDQLLQETMHRWRLLTFWKYHRNKTNRTTEWSTGTSREKRVPVAQRLSTRWVVPGVTRSNPARGQDFSRD